MKVKYPAASYGASSSFASPLPSLLRQNKPVILFIIYNSFYPKIYTSYAVNITCYLFPVYMADKIAYTKHILKLPKKKHGKKQERGHV